MKMKGEEARKQEIILRKMRDHNPPHTTRCATWSGDGRKCERAAGHAGPCVATYSPGKRDEEVCVIVPRR